MAEAVGQPLVPEPRVPDTDPGSIRSCLPPDMVVEFDREWDAVLESAKVSKDLGGIRRMLTTWRHLAVAEQREPGAHGRLAAKVERILRTGVNPDAVSVAELHEVRTRTRRRRLP